MVFSCYFLYIAILTKQLENKNHHIIMLWNKFRFMSEKAKFTDKFTNAESENVTQATTETPEKKDDAKDPQLEIAELKEALLRSIADGRNAQERMLREKNDAVKYALSGFVKDLAITMDHFYLSISKVEQKSLENPDFKSFFDAINLTIAEVAKLMEKNNVKRISPLGEAFNPKEHEALGQIPAPNGEKSGTILQVISAGYIIEERVIKPAMVIVAT